MRHRLLLCLVVLRRHSQSADAQQDGGDIGNALQRLLNLFQRQLNHLLNRQVGLFGEDGYNDLLSRSRSKA